MRRRTPLLQRSPIRVSELSSRWINKTFISESVTVIGDVVLGMSEKDKALNRKLVQDISLDKEKEQVDTAIESFTGFRRGHG